ncbi:WYL domain-containing protein [Streptomyces sp. NPDC037389]|uniref:WYL domain-containing protein n=1 Tax=Streptomyces sp. NPDC037389 TaxID=3155369 RepID=UPI0033FECC56
MAASRWTGGGRATSPSPRARPWPRRPPRVRRGRSDRVTDARPTGRRVPPRPVPGDDPAAFVAGRLSSAPTRYRAVATVHAPADHVRARTRGLATRLKPIDDATCRLDASDDHLPRIAKTLAGLDTDCTLDADPAVLDHLRRAADRALRAAA